MSSEVAIKVEGVSKLYQLYDTPRDRLKQFILPKLYKLFFRPFLSANCNVNPRYYREFWALKDISFEIKKGETVGVLGRNGSGKSTLLQLICGTLNPTSGSIVSNGRMAALLELGAGFNQDFSGRENIYMSCALLGMTAEDIGAHFEEIAAFADIGEFIEQPVKTYSSGMYVRLAFAVNIVSKPDIMVVDEALAVGDMNFQAKCITALTRLQNGGATILFVSHDIGTVKSLCSRAIYLDDGQLKCMGNAGEIAEAYMRNMREEINAEYTSNVLPVSVLKKKSTRVDDLVFGSSSEFKTSTEFERQVEYFRYGVGGVKITFAELLDSDFNSISQVKFNQDVLVKIYFESAIDEVEISCNYYILDDKKNYILGADIKLAGESSFMKINSGGKYIVTFKTKLPLQEGLYSITLEITRVIIKDQSARFIDVIEDAIVFKMLQREDGRLWAKVFIENEIEVKSCH